MRRLRHLLIALLVAAVLLWLLTPSGPSVEPGSVVVMELSGSYVEAIDAPLVARLLGDHRQTFVSLLSEMRMLERDDRIAGVVLRIRNLDIGWAKAQELRQAITDLGTAGRRTVALLELPNLGANLEYYVASAAAEVQASPGTAIPLVGLAAEYLFLGDLWKKLGAGIETEGVGEYKSATETLAGTRMSKPFREMANSLLDSLDAQFVEGIAEGRHLTPEFVRDAVDAGPSTTHELRALGLVDGVAHLDEVVESLGGGPVMSGEDYAAVDPASVGFSPVSQFALVYGSGNVTLGSGSSSPGGVPRMTSETLSRALEEASEDGRVAAIILRIDSPGGSPLAADIMWRAVRRARKSKPVIVSVSDLAASGGYYVAAGGDAIVAPPASLVGSIGVFVMRPHLGGLLEKMGIGVETITRGEYADLTLSSEPLSEAGRARLHSEIEAIYALFVSRVAEGRGLDTEAVEKVARGRVWTGAQALDRGLVDALGGLRAAVAQAKERLGLAPEDDVALLPFPAPQTLAEQIDAVLHRVAVDAAPQLPLPRLARWLAEWLAEVPEGAPMLIPPFLIEIH